MHVEWRLRDLPVPLLVRLEKGTITGVSPEYGQVGTAVTIVGARLLGGGSSVSSVSLSGIDAEQVSATTNKIVVMANQATHGVELGDVTIISDTGAVVSKEDAWTYMEEGTTVAISPSLGQHNTVVTIAGTNMQGHGNAVVSVTLAGVEVQSIESESDEEIVVVAAPSADAIEDGAVIITADTGAVVTANANHTFTYVDAAIISSVSPATGQVGTVAIISGITMRAGASNVEQVELAGVEVLQIISENDDQIIVEAAEGPAQAATGDIKLTTSSGATVTAPQDVTWGYIVPGKISSVNPSQGRLGTALTISGIDLCGGGAEVVRVELAGFEATLGDTSECGIITAKAQDYGTAVKGDVVLTSNTGSRVTSKDAWTYIAEGEIASVEPAAGQENTRITIKGSSLFGGGSGVDTVTLAGVKAFVDSADETEVVVVSFAAPEDSDNSKALLGDVVITGDTGVVVRYVNGWTYSEVTSVVPPAGQRGTVVQISGFELAAGGSSISAVSLGGVPVAEIVERSANSVKVIARRRAVDEPTAGDILITADNGQEVRLANGFTYNIAGAMNEVSPSSGHKGTVVTVKGVDLLGGGSEFISIKLAGTEVLEIIDGYTNSVVQVVADASDEVAGDIVLTSDTGSTVILDDGTAKNELVDGKWAYVAPVVIASVEPGIGQLDTRVTISGEGLFGGGSSITQVTLSGVEVQEIVNQS